MADELDLYLVEISPNAVPPVCKIVDYSKFVYEQKKKLKEIKSNAKQTVIKEIRFGPNTRSEEHTSELQSLMRISYAVFCLKKKNTYAFSVLVLLLYICHRIFNTILLHLIFQHLTSILSYD